MIAPGNWVASWACAMADVLQQVAEAESDVSMVRALKLLVALHSILLQVPPYWQQNGEK